MVKENGMVMITESEYETYKELRRLLFEVMKERLPGDVRVTRSDFLKIYNLAMETMEENSEDNEIYGRDVTVHWHGIYCNCTDGAIAYNYIIDAIKGVTEEDGDY